MKGTSIAVKIKFAHIPKTAVYNGSTKEWDYVTNPSATLLNASAAQLKAMDTASFAAVAKADDAYDLAGTKVGMTEVKSLFPVQTSDGSSRIMTDIKFIQGDGGYTIQFCTAPTLNPSLGTCGFMAYALKSDLNALKTRVDELETDVASLKNDVSKLKKLAGIP